MPIHNLYKSNFVQNVAIVTTGTASAQAILIVFSPIITRIYSPESLGLLGIFIAFTGLLTPVVTLSYSSAIVLPSSQNDANCLVWLSIYISIAMTLFLSLLLFIDGDRLLTIISADAIATYAFLIPLRMLFSGWRLIAQQWLIRNKLFRVIAIFAIATAIFVSVAKVGIGFFIPEASVLIVLSTLGLGAHAGMLYYGANKAGCAIYLPKSKYKGTSLLKIAKQYYDFPIYRTPQLFIKTASESLPVLFIAAFFGPASAGFYALGRKVLWVPLILIGNSIGDVFYPKITDAAQKGQNVYLLVAKTTFMMAFIGFLPYGIIMLFGPWAFEFIFGDGWQKAGEYARWLSVWGFFFLLSIPCTKVLPILSGLKFHLFFSCVSIILQLSCLFIGFYWYQDAIVTIALFSVSGALMNFFFIILVLMKCKRHIFKKIRI